VTLDLSMTMPQIDSIARMMLGMFGAQNPLGGP
jgi:hypothetical protein